MGLGGGGVENKYKGEDAVAGKQCTPEMNESKMMEEVFKYKTWKDICLANEGGC